MGIRQLLEKRKNLIDRELGEILPKIDAPPKRLHQAMRYSVFSGGKRIRPAFVIESCLCCGGKIKDCLEAACAIELVHTFSLVHDDLPAMDDDDYRRGKLTCHKKFDEPTAILAGDALLALAFETLSKEKRLKIAIELVKELSGSIGSLGIAGGQCTDIEYGGKEKNSKILGYINTHKTGELIKASVKMGAIASGAGAKKVKQIGEFGMAIGEAFQIIDDILDNGDSVATLGKNGAVKKARLLTKSANNSLKGFKESADILRKISDYLIERKI